MHTELTVAQPNSPEWQWAKHQVKHNHYLHTFPPAISMPFVYTVSLVTAPELGPIGTLVFNRVKAQRRCGDWYGSVEDAAAGVVEVTRWQVLNLARVFLVPEVQQGGSQHTPELLPGFVDRRGVFRSTLATSVIHQCLNGVGLDYLLQRCVVFENEPYEITHCLSYQDTRVHRGVIYKQAGFEFYRQNKTGILTWRRQLKPLTDWQHAQVLAASDTDKRARMKRGARVQTEAQIAMVI